MKTVYLQLGRAGDILNVLPLLKRDFDETGQKSAIVVSRPFASILDGVTYAEAIPVDLPFEDVIHAYEIAEKAAKERGARVVCTQIYGEGVTTSETCSSFMREAWEQVPGSPPWGTLPLVFDNRDPGNEIAVAAHFGSRSTGKPYIVLALNGTSSPFEHAGQLSALLRGQLRGEFDVFEVSAFIAPRFFDLLTLLENAHCIVAVDSGVLHLAHACPKVPVVALITREPSRWHGSPWRRQHCVRVPYDLTENALPLIVEAVRRARSGELAPVIAHVWSHFDAEVSADARRRMNFARETWKAEYAVGFWEEREFKREHCRRRSDVDPIGDERPMPFVRDLLNHAVAGLRLNDIVAFTNADVAFAPGLTGWVFDAINTHGAAFTHRWDFDRLEKPFRSEAQVKRGRFYPGSDAFFFTVDWLNEHLGEYPDMILGREQCDEVLRQLVKRHGGIEIRGAIYHEKHASFWEDAANREKNAGNRHNRKLARKFFMRHGYGPNDPDWWKLPLS